LIFDRNTQQTSEKMKIINEGIKYLSDLNLIDAFYDEIWSEEVIKLLDKCINEKTYHDLSLEETEKIQQYIVEWFGENYRLASIKGEFWIISVGAVEEGGHQWWYKIKINTDKLETARKVIMFHKSLNEN
jgi:hypothetical protein